MRRRTKVRVALAVWLLLAAAMLLAPAPREWGVFGKWISSHYDRVRLILQPAGHMVLMAICVFLLMEGLRHRSPRSAFLISAGIAMLFALALELLQSILPDTFARTCDLWDLLPSLAGMLAGGGIGLFRRSKNRNN